MTDDNVSAGFSPSEEASRDKTPDGKGLGASQERPAEGADARILNNVRIVLVNTTHSGNIGAVARAMKNMAISQLYLVEPRDYPSEEAMRRAASALDILDNAQVVDTLDDALEGVALAIGTSARERTIPWPLIGPRECARQVIAEVANHPVAIVFGREDRGLTNDELRKCHMHLHIPTNEVYSSLNVAAAVQIVCYELRMQLLEAKPDLTAELREWDEPAASYEDMERLYEHLEQVLSAIGFIPPDNPRQTMTRFRRLFNRARLDKMEMAMFRGVLRSIMKGRP